LLPSAHRRTTTSRVGRGSSSHAAALVNGAFPETSGAYLSFSNGSFGELWVPDLGGTETYAVPILMSGIAAAKRTVGCVERMTEKGHIVTQTMRATVCADGESARASPRHDLGTARVTEPG
jgi:hypothetical protein